MPERPGSFSIDTAASRVRVRTRARGVLARLAHDLELVGPVEGEATTVDAEAWTAVLRVRAGDLRVTGTLHGDRVDPSGISSSDRAEIERRMRADVFAGAPELVVRGSGSSTRAGEAVVDAGRTPAGFPLRLDVHDLDDRRVGATVRATLLLSRLGVPEIKGPLGAFRLDDRVEVIADLVLVPAT